MFRGGYGVLKLLPRELYRLTPGEYADMMLARAWVNEQRQSSGPMSEIERAQKVAQLDQKLARARGEHR